MQELLDAIYKYDFCKIKEMPDIKEKLNKPYNKHGWTPFMLIVKEFYEEEIVEDFIKLGGDVNLANNQGQTPLMIASQHRSSPDVIELLIRYRADVDHQDNYGHTAIMKLLKHPQLAMRKDVLQALIDNGCDLTTLRNIQGKTAMDMIVERI